MLNSRPVRLLWHSLNWLTRMTLIALTGTLVLCAIIIVLLRYWLLPDVEQFHDRIATSISTAMGNPVSIGKIRGDWDRLQPHLSLTDVRLLDNQGETALLLPRIDASVSWLSLLAAQLRLSSLEIDHPQLLIRRDEQGHIFIGGVELATGGGNNDLANWLLHQQHMEVRDAAIVWLDLQRDAPPLRLNQVNLRIENFFSHHQFALRAIPPAEISTPLDVRGDFHGRRFDDLDQWRGQLFTQLDHTDILAWHSWLNLPPQLSRGRGALRAWLGVANGKISQFTADLVLRDVATQLSPDVPELDVHYLRGRAAWKTVGNGWEVDTRHLSLRLHNGVKLLPTDFYFRTEPASGRQPASGELRANLLQLESLVSLANFFPLEAKMRSQLDAYAPRGRVSNLEMKWTGSTEKLLSYKIKGEFENLAMLQTASLPGFSGLTMAVDGNEKNGTLSINARNLTVNAPGIMREPLLFNTLTGQTTWQQNNGELFVRADNFSIANEDLAGNLNGSYQTKAGTLGLVDMTISLTRGELKHAARYTPLIALAQKDNDWLNDALLSGHTEDFRLRLKGNMSDFPIDGSKDALFEINAHAHDVGMQYAPDWPKIENLAGDFSIHNNRMEVHAQTGSILGAQISNLSIIQPDMAIFDNPLEIKGEADGDNSAYLQFIQQSPVREYIKGFTDGITASGNGHLNLSAQIPLLLTKPAKISGLLKVQGSDIDMGGVVPWLRNTQGELAFTESGMKTRNVTANILGGPARLEVQTAEGGMVRATLQGRMNLEAFRKIESNPLLAYLHGGSAWNASISMLNKTAQVQVNSSLQGISSTLPAPFTKSTNEIWPLHIEKKNIDLHQDMISAQLGKLFVARMLSVDTNGVSTIKRGVIDFGTQNTATLPVKDGIWLTGNLPVLSLQGWDDLNTGSGPSLPISGANLHIDNLTGYGINLNNVNISASKRGDAIAAQLSGEQLNGELTWQPQGYNGTAKITARLRNLYWISAETPKPPPAPVKLTEAMLRHQKLPALDISIDDLTFKKKQIGRFELVGYPEEKNWHLRRLHISNPDGTVTGEGLWRETKSGMQTQINLMMDISDAGKILARSGYPNTVKNGSGKLLANLTWEGQPDEFNYATLGGTLKLDTGKGQFLKMDPGIGKLLGILSLQALPKRITLDFTDVFSAGFEFDNINGNATLSRGIMQTEDLFMDGSSAKVTMKGRVNLNDETQDMHIVVLPTLGSSVSMLSAFAAGPVIGLGTLIVSKILGNPLDHLMSFEYNVSGPWSNPNVIKVGETPVKLQTVLPDTKHKITP